MAERAHPEDPGFQEGSPYRVNLFRRYAFANKFTEGKMVLDIPCGVGWGTSLLKGKYKIAIDNSADAIAYGKKHYPGIDFLVGDMAGIPLKDNSVDVVVCLEGFEHVSKATGMQFLAEAVRVIKDDGLLIMTVPVILPGGKHSGNPYHLHEPSLSDLKNVLAQKFDTQSLEIVKGADGPVVYFVGSPKDSTSKPEFSHEQSSIRYPQKSQARILLTTSAAPVQSPFSTNEKRPPVGVGFLISVLRNAGHEVFFIDNYLQPNNFLETDFLQKHQIDYVGIYANTICFRDTLRMLYKLEKLRQSHQWDGKILVGGPHTTVAADTIPDFVDYVVQGEGELAILDIVNGKIGQRVVNYPRIENLDVLPMPAWDCFVDLPYHWSVRFFEDKPVFTMNTSRGCPFNCVFCSVGSVWGKKYTYFSAERIVSDIEYLIKRYGLKGAYFREDNFTLNKERLRRFCNLLIEKEIKISWVCESRVSNLSRDLVELMSRAGAKGFYFGVESGSQRILDLLHKGITVEQIKNAFEWCREFNVKTAASIIVGVPGEAQADRQKTDELLKDIKPDVVWTNIFVGIPDSSLYRFVLNSRRYEYIDDRGLLYLQGHNSRVKCYYSDNARACIPDNENNKDMTIKPKVSVLMSVYNGEKFIEKALQSIYNQTYQDFEVIIVDDGSTDRTPDILFNMKDSRTFIYRNPENKGLTKSLNIGLKLCRGEYIARMDADDISYPRRFEKQVRFLDENPDCAALGCWCNRIDYNDRIWGAYNGRPTEPEDIKRQLLIGNCIAHPTAILRRASLAKVAGYNEKYDCAQDHDLWLRLSEHCMLYNLPEYLVGLRSWPENISTKKKEQQDKCSSLAIQEALQRRKIAEPAAVEKNKKCESPGPLVSVIMPAYNAAEYIAKAIESVLVQDYGNFELIIIDDGSTDSTKDIVAGFKDSRIRYFHKENSGLAATHNMGIKASAGALVSKVDADDIITPDFISRHLSEFEKHPDADLIYCDDLLIDEEDEPIRIIARPEYGDRKVLIRNLFRCGFPIVPFRTCIKRSVFDQIGFFDEDLAMAEDYDMMRRFVEKGLKACHLRGALYLRRMTDNSLSRRFTEEKAKAHFAVVERFIDTFSYDELFPDVEWEKIEPQRRHLNARCLAAMTIYAIGQSYSSNAPVYTRIASERAFTLLDDCLRAEPKNALFRKLAKTSELIRPNRDCALSNAHLTK